MVHRDAPQYMEGTSHGPPPTRSQPKYDHLGSWVGAPALAISHVVPFFVTPPPPPPPLPLPTCTATHRNAWYLIRVNPRPFLDLPPRWKVPRGFCANGLTSSSMVLELLHRVLGVLH